MSVVCRPAQLLPTVLAGVLLAACAGGRSGSTVSAQGTYKVGPPYEVNGVWYYPRVDYHYDKTGIASWYGEDYQGRPTANGEIYDLNRLSAAHPTLPMPSVVRVTNLDNGRSLKLRVNDRGPFAKGRIIDVSRRAAQLLGFERKGIAPVEVKVLKQDSIRVAERARHEHPGVVVAAAAPAPASPPAAKPSPAPRRVMLASRAPPPSVAPKAVRPPQSKPPAVVREPAQRKLPPPQRDFASLEAALVAHRPGPAPAGKPETVAEPPSSPAKLRMVAFKPWFFVQAGAFSSRNNALRVQSRLAGLGPVKVIPALVDEREVYRVRLGPLPNETQADRALSRVIGRGYADARIVFD